MNIGESVYDLIAQGLAEHFAAGWCISGYDWPAAAPEIPAVTVFPGGHDSFVATDGFGTQLTSWSLTVWLSADDERQSLRQFYAMTEAAPALADSFAAGPSVGAVTIVRVLEPRIVQTVERGAAFLGQFDLTVSVSIC